MKMAFAASKDYENTIIECEIWYLNILPLALKRKKGCLLSFIHVYERNFKAIYALLFETQFPIVLKSL